MPSLLPHLGQQVTVAQGAGEVHINSQSELGVAVILKLQAWSGHILHLGSAASRFGPEQLHACLQS